MPNNKLKILENLLDVVSTKENSNEMAKTFVAILEIFKKMKGANEKERQEIKQLLEKTIAELKSDHSGDFENIKIRIEKVLGEALKEQANSLNFIKNRVSKLKNGKDGTDGYTPRKNVDYFDGENGKQGEKGDKPDHKWNGTKLSFENPDGTWGKEVDLKGDRGNNYALFGGGGGAGGGHIVKSYDLSGQLNGVLKVFSLPAFWRVISVHSSSFPNILRPTVDYQTDGAAMTITFTSEIEAASTLATSQTLLVTYAE